MEKNEVYDYLAKIYFAKKADKKEERRSYRFLLFLIPVIIIILWGYVFFNYPVRQAEPKTRSLYLSGASSLIQLQYDFAGSNIKKAGWTITFPDLNVRGFQNLTFEARHLKKESPVNLRVEVANKLNEVSQIYVNDIAGKWARHSINLTDFKEITDWQNLKSLSFIAEEWNVSDKEDIIYIDTIRFSQ